MFTTRTLFEGKWPLLSLAALASAGLVWFWPGGVIALLLLLFTISFFRDPQRAIPADPRAIVSPADGRVVAVTTAPDPHYLQSDTTMVAIFLSVFDVHVQRAPIAGAIKLVKYQSGKFFDVRNPRASAENEFRVIGIEGPDGYRVTVRQIAGLIARRIVGWKHEGDQLAKGEHLGMIRFGSRVEIFMPRDVEVAVKPGDYAKGGETILAKRPA